MEKALFSITCTTCRARLKVFSESAIGAILECPKCGSMVLVSPPANWRPSAARGKSPPERAAGQPPGEAAATATSPAELPAAETPPAVSETPQSSSPPARAAAAAAVFGGATGSHPPPLPSHRSVSPGPPQPPAGADRADPLDARLEGAAAEAGAAPAGPPPIAAPGASPVELLWRKWLLWTTASAGAIVVAVAAWVMFFSGGSGHTPPVPAPDQKVQPAPDPSSAGNAPAAGPPLARLDRRWLPDRAALVASFRPSQFAALAVADRLIDQAGPTWQPTAGAAIEAFGLRMDRVERMTWIAADLENWPQRSVVVAELREQSDARRIGALGQAMALRLAGAVCRRLPGEAWPHPFAIVDGRTLVSGDEDLLRHLATRSEAHLESRSLAALLEAAPADAEAVLLVDLAAARRAGWTLPTACFDIWEAGRQPWHVIWNMADGAGAGLRWSGRVEGQLLVACDGQTAAEKVQAAVGQLLPAADAGLGSLLQSLPGRLQAGEITAKLAGQYRLLLEQSRAALKGARVDVRDEIVRVDVDWTEGLASLAEAAIEGRTAVQADWLAAARMADQHVQRQLLSGLLGHQKAEGRFPDGAHGGALLAPETRLSWIATMLPYYGHPDWHRRLEFGYSWNGPQNRPITGQALPEVVNPALGPGVAESGFPVTHYVGVAGVGAGAGRLPPDDPRAGVFGYGRGASLDEIRDGASNTIAILGVSGRLGPWAAGGDPTVRALTQRPYVNGPDGFGSGQPDGMLAGMADGSVRFISKDIDPRVLEQLATKAGGEDVTVLALGPRSIIDQPQAPPAPEVPEQPAAPVEPAGPAGQQPPEQPAEPDVPRAAPPQVDVPARLADAIPAIELKDVPMAQAVGVLASLSGVPMSFDPDALADMEVTLHDPVSVSMQRAPVGKVLEAILNQEGLAYVIEKGQLMVTSPPAFRQQLRRLQYTVSDLAEGDPGAAELTRMIEELVAPDTWRSHGGQGTISADHGVLAIEQTGPVHRAVLTFCEKLRTARGRPLRSKLDPDRFTLATRTDRARVMLDRTVTANFHHPAPLVQILTHLGDASQADLVIDRLGLAAAGTSDQVETSVVIADRSLGEALDELLRPLGMAFRAVDSETIQVSTRRAVEARLELEFYSVAKLLGPDRTAEALIEQVKSNVAGPSWSDAGGPAAVCFDRPSGCLIVLQSQPVQRLLEQFLDAERKQAP